MKKNLYLVQAQDVLYPSGSLKYAHLPLSVAYLWAYAKNEPTIYNNFHLSGLIYEKLPLDELVESFDNPSIIGLSSYVWNWEFNMHLAKVVKNIYPVCLIVIGGPHVPEHDTDFFKNHPQIDILVHGEGELTFHEILLRCHNSQNYDGIIGTSINKDGICVYQGQRERINDLMIIPSPYLDGVFDDLLTEENVAFSGGMEHTRGCPYSCTFCNVGQDYYRKVRTFSVERTYAEIDWISKHKIDYISYCDSNFGLSAIDMDIAKYLVKKKLETGFPKTFKTDWAKNKTKSVISIVKLLEQHKMNKGFTVAVQSMDPNVLDIIKRRNISNLEQAALLKEFSKENIKTYSELILALPGETYQGFIKGFGELIEAGQHNCIDVYPCMVLPNSDYTKRDFKEKHGIKTWISPQANYFIKEEKRGHVVEEFEENIYETSAMSYTEWKKAYLFSILGTWGHFFGFTHIFARFLRVYKNTEYNIIYENLMTWALNNPDTFLGKEAENVVYCINQACNNNGYLGRNVEGVFWEFNQSIGVNAIKNKKQLYIEFTEFLRAYIDDDKLIFELIDLQENFVIDHTGNYPKHKQYTYNFTDYILKKCQILKKENINVQLYMNKVSYNGNLSEFCRDKFWIGRRIGGCKASMRKFGSQNSSQINLF